MADEKQERNLNIDLIKIISCIGVVGLHVFYQYGESSTMYRLIYNMGIISIPLFFMASGYFMLNRSVDWKKIINKIKKIILFVTIWGIAFWLLYGIIDHNLTLYQLAVNIFGPYIQKGHLGQFWFLASLIIVYLLSPILIKFKMKNHTMYYILLFSLILLSAILSYIDITSGKVMEGHFIQTFRLWIWLPYFMIGGEMPHIKRFLAIKIQKNKAGLNIFACGIILCLLSVYACYIENIQHNMFAEYIYDDFVTYICVFIIFLLLDNVVIHHNGVMFNRLIVSLSTLTVGIYIIHPTVIKLLEHIAILSQNPIILFLASFICSSLGAYIINKISFFRKISI